MKLDLKRTNTFLSLIIIATWAEFVFLISHSNSSNKLFGLDTYRIFTQLAGVVAGFLVVVWEVRKSKFIYNLAGTFNFCLGLLGIVLFQIGHLSELNFIILFIINLSIGVYILFDIYRRQ